MFQPFFCWCRKQAGPSTGEIRAQVDSDWISRGNPFRGKLQVYNIEKNIDVTQADQNLRHLFSISNLAFSEPGSPFPDCRVGLT